MALKVGRNKFQWVCEDCGVRILPEKIMGTYQLHCNCMAVQAMIIRQLKDNVDEAGVEGLIATKKRQRRVPAPKDIDKFSASSRGLHDWQPETLERIANARKKQIQ